jgi:uncharacterized protein
MQSAHIHASHEKIVNRLKRAAGHLHNVVEMMESGAPCVQVSQQLQAVERAIVAAKKALIHDHLEHCLLDSMEHGQANTEARRVMDELKDITKYL